MCVSHTVCAHHAFLVVPMLCGKEGGGRGREEPLYALFCSC